MNIHSLNTATLVTFNEIVILLLATRATVSHGFLLDDRVAKQRRLYRQGNLLLDRISALESVDPHFFSEAAEGDA
jgi:hypothetical protein